MNKVKVTYLLSLLFGLIASAISWLEMSFPYLPDSDNYIEQARSFMAKGTFEVTPWSTEHIDKVTVPDKAFPPGFPLLIAIFSFLFRQPAEVVAPLLSLSALLLIPPCTVFSFHRIIGLWPSFWIGLFVAFTPIVITLGYFAYSDLISLLLVIFSVNRLLVAGNKVSAWFYLGLLTGFSYLLRNANIALLISIFLYLCLYLITEKENRKFKIYNLSFWLLGNAVFMLPIFIYNYLVFGKLQPYSMPPSTVGLTENIYDYIFSQLDTLLGFTDLVNIFTNYSFMLLLLACILAWSIRQTVISWNKWPKLDQKTFLISIAYTVIGIAITIIARTKYQWGVHINDRYTLPYSCFIFVSLFIVYKNTAYKINCRYLIPGLVFTLLLIRIDGIQKLLETRHYSHYRKELKAVSNAAERLKNNPDALCTNINGRIAMSNLDYVYRVVCAVPVRRLTPVLLNQNKFIDALLTKWINVGAEKGIIISLFTLGRNQDSLPLKPNELIKLNLLGWEVERNNNDNLIISHKPLS